MPGAATSIHRLAVLATQATKATVLLVPTLTNAPPTITIATSMRHAKIPLAPLHALATMDI